MNIWKILSILYFFAAFNVVELESKSVNSNQMVECTYPKYPTKCVCPGNCMTQYKNIRLVNIMSIMINILSERKISESFLKNTTNRILNGNTNSSLIYGNTLASCSTYLAASFIISSLIGFNKL